MVSSTRRMPDPRGRSFSERLTSVSEVVLEYHRGALQQPGSVLSAKARLGIAYAARHALLNYKEQGSDKIATLSDHMAPELALALEGVDGGAPDAPKNITRFIYAVINQQHLLNKDWYLQTLRHLDETGLIPEKKSGKMRDYFLQTLFCEILLVATMSHSIHSLYLGLGQDPPKLPELESASDKKPYWFDWTNALKPHKEGLYYSGSWAPYLPRFAIDRKSPEFAKIDANLDLETFFASVGFFPTPFVAVSYAVADYIWFRKWFDVVYVSLSQAFFFPFKALDPHQHCSDSVTRFDIETVASAVSNAHHCGK